MIKLDKTQRAFVKKQSLKYGLTEDQISEIIESPFLFIRETITELNISEIKTEEEFKQKAKNFNIPSIGKLYANIYNFKKYMK